jgi:hypothetical protein
MHSAQAPDSHEPDLPSNSFPRPDLGSLWHDFMAGKHAAKPTKIGGKPQVVDLRMI